MRLANVATKKGDDVIVFMFGKGGFYEKTSIVQDAHCATLRRYLVGFSVTVLLRNAGDFKHT